MAVLKALLFGIGAGATVLVAGGGPGFLQGPVGPYYLALWVAWWMVVAAGRQRGTPSQYDDRSRWLTVAYDLTALVLVVVPPWEYVNFSGPIPRDGRLAAAGLCLFAVSILVQSAAMWELRGFYTSRLGIQPRHRLVTSGLYGVVRHPGYLSNMMALAGIGFALGSVVGLMLALLTVPLILERIDREEEMLLAEFGAAYRDYVRRTSRLVPGIY